MIVEWNTHIFSPDTAKYPHDPNAPKKLEDLVAQELGPPASRAILQGIAQSEHLQLMPNASSICAW